MQTGWIVLLGVGIATAWACWMVARALVAPSEPFGQGGYGEGSESEKIRRHQAKAS
jgi:hypothetical protein